ncbi:MAG: DVU_1553 family AMP-dependent CoA ligase [Desulfovibrionaceae bacterium]
MTQAPPTMLDRWAARKIGADSASFSREALDSWRLKALQELLQRVRSRSPFYRDRLPEAAVRSVQRLEDVRNLPFTTPEDIRDHGLRMLCVSQDQAARVVTQASSGATGPPKRLFFSEADLEATIDFFQYGMLQLAAPGDTALILLPGETPDSVGDLLSRALKRSGVRSMVHGLVADATQAAEAMAKLQPDCIVGFPVHILAMAEKLGPMRGRSRNIAVLFCSDYCVDSIANRLRKLWPCRIFNHYGTVESGLGGAVECGFRCGAHVREPDLLVEIVDPETGNPLPAGAWGEIVLTTLSREAMPLIRYRTGDVSRLAPGSCPCGSVLGRLDKVRGRIDNMPVLQSGRRLELARLDELLFALPEVFDYSATLDIHAGRERLSLKIASAGQGDLRETRRRIASRLAASPEWSIVLDIQLTNDPAPLCAGKRTIDDRRFSSCTT